MRLADVMTAVLTVALCGGVQMSDADWTGEGQQPDGSWRLEAEFFGR